MRRQTGFTLVELMITVLVIGILAGIAYPSYTRHVTRTGRQDARDGLLRVAAAEEKFNSECGGYTAVMNGSIGGAAGVRCTGLGLPGATATTFTTERRLYTITVATAGLATGSGGGVGATSFVATAVPTVAQSGDAARCATLVINNALAKSATGTEAVGVAGGKCWSG